MAVKKTVKSGKSVSLRKQLVVNRDRVKRVVKEVKAGEGDFFLTLPANKDYSRWKPVKGSNNRIVIVPFLMTSKHNIDKVQNEPWFTLSYLKHFKIGLEEKTVICPLTFGKPCPICEKRQDLLKKGYEKTSEECKALFPKQRNLYNVVDMNEKEKGVQIFEIAKFSFYDKLFEELFETEDETDDRDMFMHVDNGSVLKVRFNEEKFNANSFLKASRIDFVPLNKPMLDSWLEEAVSFDTALVVKPYAELEALLMDGYNDDEDGDEDEIEEVEVLQRKQATKKRSSKYIDEDETEDEEDEIEDEEDEEDEDEEDEDETEDEEDEEDEDEEDEDETEDEEDEDPKPRKSKAVKKDVVKTSKKQTKSNKDFPCSGTFGETCDEVDECEDCDVWENCRTKTDEFLKAQKRKKK